MNLAICKAQIIIYGIDFGNYSYNQFAEHYKTKRKHLKPVVEKHVVYDSLECNEWIPSEVLIEVGGECSLVKTRHNPLSSIKVICHGLHLKLEFRNENFECNAQLVTKPDVLKDVIRIDEKEYQVKDFLSIVGLDRISLLLFDGCGNWNMGHPCKFCDMHPKPKGEKITIPCINKLYSQSLDLEEWWEKDKKVFLNGVCQAYKKVLDSNEIGPHYHNFIMAGSLPDANFTWRFAYQLLSVLKQYIKGDIILNLQPHTNKEILIQLKDMGVKTVQYNIEVFGEKKYQDICPGKIQYSLLVNKMREAVEIFGKGNVRSNFVLGLQPICEVKDGIEMLASIGVVPDYSIFQPKKNTPYEKHEIASVDDVVECSMFLCEIYRKYNYKPIFCKLSSRSSIMNEMYQMYEKNS